MLQPSLNPLQLLLAMEKFHHFYLPRSTSLKQTNQPLGNACQESNKVTQRL